jgi:hypothetical protein
MDLSVKEWAAEYRGRGWAVARIKPGEKRPKEEGWNQRSCEPEEFLPGWGVGIQAGALSGNLVCVDIDCFEALAEADRYLPGTGMVEGRDGKPASHRWYVVTDVLPEFQSTAGVGGGPRTLRFRKHAREGGMVVEVIGTGGQAVVPSSLWRKDGREEARRWDRFGEPAVVAQEELLGAVARLAAAHGGKSTRWERRHGAPTSRERRTGAVKGEAPPPLPMPTGDVARAARNYVAKMAPAVEGRAGDFQTWAVACVLVRDFVLSPEEALPVLLEYNRRCVPPWPLHELRRKLEAADEYDGERGEKVRASPRKVVVCFDAEDPEVLVGPGAAGKAGSTIDLSPGLWAGVVRENGQRALHPELAAIPWSGKTAILAPPSTVATNQGEAWEEFWLAQLLRRAGARVRSLRLPPKEGRRSTLADFDSWQELLVVRPPSRGATAKRRAEEAAELAKAVDAERRALPRNRPSPKLKKALAYLGKQKAQALTEDLLRRARRAGHSRATLFRAWSLLQETKSKHTPLSKMCSVPPLTEAWFKPG